MGADELALIAGTVLSLTFSYLPGLRDRFDQLQAETKRLVMLAMVIVVASVIYGLSCLSIGAEFGIGLTCDRAGLVGLLRAIILSAVANQGTYGLTKHG
jgi:ABC-type multidrug transport system permease subunit